MTDRLTGAASVIGRAYKIAEKSRVGTGNYGERKRKREGRGGGGKDGKSNGEGGLRKGECVLPSLPVSDMLRRPIGAVGVTMALKKTGYQRGQMDREGFFGVTRTWKSKGNGYP